MRRVAEQHSPDLVPEFAAAAEQIHAEIVNQAWNEQMGSFTGSYGARDLDASLLQLASLRFLDRGDPRLVRTVEAIARELDRNGWLLRYGIDDGFGRPQVSFVICNLWYSEALAWVGRLSKAQEVLGRALDAATPLGLLSEDYDPTSARQWGNFPQAYSHVGLIHAAFAASPRWTEVT
jgi:GH15 family glucan-1,4-alpha-glucosidase